MNLNFHNAMQRNTSATRSSCCWPSRAQWTRYRLMNRPVSFIPQLFLAPEEWSEKRTPRHNKPLDLGELFRYYWAMAHASRVFNLESGPQSRVDLTCRANANRILNSSAGSEGGSLASSRSTKTQTAALYCSVQVAAPLLCQCLEGLFPLEGKAEREIA